MALDPKVRAYLEEPRYAVLATINPDGSPHLTEMWYGMRDGRPYFNTTEERFKKRNLERDPRISLLVGSKKGDPTWRSTSYVRIDGTTERIATGKEALEDIVGLSVRYDGPGSEASARETFSKMHRVTYAIRVRRVYAKAL